jgi:uncharacterized protein YxeA
MKKIIIILTAVFFIFIVGIIIANRYGYIEFMPSIPLEMTNTTKLALCSNEYYETEYDENGIIIVKD